MIKCERHFESNRATIDNTYLPAVLHCYTCKPVFGRKGEESLQFFVALLSFARCPHYQVSLSRFSPYSAFMLLWPTELRLQIRLLSRYHISFPFFSLGYRALLLFVLTHSIRDSLLVFIFIVFPTVSYSLGSDTKNKPSH
jgi:hypothetical protein